MTADVSDSELVHGVAEILRRRAGLHLGGSRSQDLGAAVSATAKGLSASDYLARLEDGGTILDELLDLVTVGETYFFRDPRQLELLRGTIIPALLRERPWGHLRIWSAGCATGEEPYTLAIMLHDMGLGERARIVGTDVSRPALRAANLGRYREWSLRSTPERFAARHFKRRGVFFDLDPHLQRHVELSNLNLARDDYPSIRSAIGNFDLILCRNVLIYFDAATVAGVSRRLLASLREGGWLLLGASDPPLIDVPGVQVHVTDAGLAYQRSEQTIGAPPWTAEEDERRTPAPVTDSGRENPKPTLAPPATAPPAEPAGSAARNEDVATHARLVTSFADRGDLAGARRALDHALRRHPQAADLRLLDALVLGEAGHLSEAIRAARSALFLDRTSVLGHVTLGALLTRSGEAERGARAYRAALRLLDARDPAEVVAGFDGESVADVIGRVGPHLGVTSTSEATE